MRGIRRVWDRLLDLCAGLAAGLTAVLTLGVCADVILRSLTDGGLPWVFDLVEYGMLFITALMAAPVLREGRHVEVDLVVSLVPGAARRWMRVAGALLCLLVSGVLALAAAEAARRSFVDGSVIFRYVLIPEWIPFAGVALMFALLAVECGRMLARRWSARSGDGPGRSDLF